MERGCLHWSTSVTRRGRTQTNLGPRAFDMQRQVHSVGQVKMGTSYRRIISSRVTARNDNVHENGKFYPMHYELLYWATLIVVDGGPESETLLFLCRLSKSRFLLTACTSFITACDAGSVSSGRASTRERSDGLHAVPEPQRVHSELVIEVQPVKTFQRGRRRNHGHRKRGATSRRVSTGSGRQQSRR